MDMSEENEPVVIDGTGDLANHCTLANFDAMRFNAFVRNAIAVPVRYEMGAKIALGQWPITDTLCDCSGFARAAVYHATNGATEGHMPDGSWNQDDWLKHTGLLVHEIATDQDYLDAIDDDAHIRLCIHIDGGRGDDPTGHVWFVSVDSDTGVLQTSECYGGVGVGHLPFDEAWRLQHCDLVAVLA
jgi:hypothetical protein